ncbi:MAG: hypothetical protein NVSMB56_12710 [Pyrinomonadaceae bacterium]
MLFRERDGRHKFMEQLKILGETIATYRKYGWTLRRALLTQATLDAVRSTENVDEKLAFDIENVALRESGVDALWFSRASTEGREAWELRFVSPIAYALFEIFEADEADEDREDVRREMEARLREQFGKKENQPRINAD